MELIPDVTSATNPAPPLLGTSQNQILGKDDFLKILVTQLRNQDPIDPVNADEFASQLAQFSSVEQLQNINSALANNLDLDLLLNQALNNTLATTLIGNTVKAIGDLVNLVDDNDAILNYRLTSPAHKVAIQITDVNGVVVRNIELDGQTAGDHSFEWDGKNDSGDTVPEGVYQFSVNGTDAEGNRINTITFVTGLINSIRYNNGNALLLIGDIEVSLSDVFEIGLGAEDSRKGGTRVSVGSGK